MNIQRVILGLVVLCLLAVLPMSAMGQEPEIIVNSLEIKVPVDYFTSYEFSLDVDVTGMQGRDIYLGVWPVYADFDMIVPAQCYGCESIGSLTGSRYSDVNGNLHDGVQLNDVPYESTQYDLLLSIDNKAFPIGTLEWYPEIRAVDPETNEVIARASLNGGNYHTLHETISWDPNRLSSGSELPRTEINNIIYMFDEEKIGILFDLELSGFPLGSEVVIIARPAKMAGQSMYFGSTDVVPEGTDSEGHVASAFRTIITESTQSWSLIEGPISGIVWPLANFKENASAYSIYANFDVYVSSGGGKHTHLYTLYIGSHALGIPEF